MQLIAILNRAITVAPTYSYTTPLISGVLMYGVLAPFCNTQAGYRAFTNPNMNAILLNQPPSVETKTSRDASGTRNLVHSSKILDPDVISRSQGFVTARSSLSSRTTRTLG
ncbi:hypothetical protein J3R82DRAFT_7965 [Butyriboletus roseoflavus]|nr:hypothetical protein J3R82DRAFT_7965 [Butyriboletus roseoflavus]